METISTVCHVPPKMKDLSKALDSPNETLKYLSKTLEDHMQSFSEIYETRRLA